MFQSEGILKYTDESSAGIKLVLEIDPGISAYYRALIPKWFDKPKPQFYSPHISLVRRETPPNMEHWKKHEGRKIAFQYSNEIQFGEVYCWLNCFSKEFEEIRLELGLPVSSPYTLPPEGFFKCFHTTIGNYKLQPWEKT